MGHASNRPDEPGLAPAAGPPTDVLDTQEAGGKVIRGGVLRTGSYIAGVLVGIVATPFMVRHLGVVDFGRFITVTSLIFIVSGLTEVGLTSVGVREYTNQGASDRRRLMRNLLGVRLVLSFVGAAGALAFSLIAGYPRVMVLGTAVSGAGLVLTNLYLTLTIPLNVELRLGWISALDVIRQVATAGLTLVLVAVGASLLPFYAVAAGSGAIVLAVSVLLVARTVPLMPAFRARGWWMLLRDSIPYAVATGLAVVYFRIAIVIMSLVSSDRETGFYSLAFRIIEIVSGLPWLLIFSAFPILARAAGSDENRFRYALQRLFDVSVIVSAWIAVSVALGARFAVEVVGGRGFDPAVVPLRILGGAMVGTFLIATWSYALLSQRRHRDLLVANATALVLGFALALALSGPYGAVGAAVATLATELTLAVIYLVLLIRSDRALRPSGTLVPRVVAAAGAALAVGLPLPAHDVVRVVLASAVYFTALAVLRAIPPEIRQALLRRPAGGAA